ncbi:MAG: hypothetical protein RLZZ15_2839 [Verrucomicrobiota bacterium]
MHPLPASTATARDLPLEGLRGLCAGAVLYAHVFAPTNALDPRWAPPSQFWWFNFGDAAVLIFFTLSGYVIGLTTTGAAAPAARRDYLARRALRLGPITAFAILLAWALAPATPLRTVIGNLLFLQNAAPYPGGFSIPVLPNNPNLWSLHYEAAYYLGFLALWRWAPRAGVVWGALIGLTFAPLLGLAPGTLVGRLACGGLFWFGGLCVAWQTPAGVGEPAARRTAWPAALLGSYAIWSLAPLRTFLVEGGGERLLWPTVASPHRLDFLPACVWLLLATTGRAPALCRALAVLCLGWATLGLGYYVVAGALVTRDYAAAVALAAAWLAWRWRPEATALARLAPGGAISFGVYAVALPIQFGQRDWLPEFAGSAFTFFVRAGVVVGAAVAAAWFLERRLQPWLRRRLAPRATR